MFSHRSSVSRGCSLAAAALALVALAGTASASVIYQDNFNGSSSTPLAGQAPTIDNGPSTSWSNQWNTAWMDNGSVTVTSSTDLEVASLEFTPQSGQIYTLSLSLNPTSGSNFMAFGFTNGNGTGAPFWNTTGPWMDVWLPNGITGQAGPGTGNAVFNTGVSSFNEPAQIVLNTVGADWTVQWSYNGIALGSYVYSGASGSNPNPTGITQVAIGSDGDNGSVADFSLTAVPEPSVLGLVMLGGLGLLLIGRKRVIRRSV